MTCIAALASGAVLSCAASRAVRGEILIGLEPEAVLLLHHGGELDPFDTGIPSLDSLNRKWNVQRMIPVFPAVSPDDEAAIRHGLGGIYKLVVPSNTDLKAIVQDYPSDPNVEYAELNEVYEIE